MENQQPSALPPLPPLPEEHADANSPEAPPASQSVTESMQALKTPPPPPPPIAMRSLQSDLQSLADSGGIESKAAVVKLDDLELPMPSVAMPLTETAQTSFESGNEKKKTALSVLGTLILITVAGVAGYWWIYPAIFGDGSKTASVVEKNIPVSTAPEPIVHRSLFAKLPTLVATVKIQQMTRAEIIQALQQEAANDAPATSMKELALTDGSGAPLRFSDVMMALLPGLDKGDIENAVENDFTGFLYYNGKGAWPGYVAKLKATAIVADTQAVFAKLEGLDVAQLYLKDPGVAGGFQTGPFKGAPIRYNAFTAPGASFNYGVVGDYIIIATSFDAFKESVDLLGL